MPVDEVPVVVAEVDPFALHTAAGVLGGGKAVTGNLQSFAERHYPQIDGGHA